MHVGDKGPLRSFLQGQGKEGRRGYYSHYLGLSHGC